MKRLVIFTMLLTLVSFAFAKGWKVESDLNLTLTQSQYSDNWSGDELSNVTWVASSNSSAEKQMKEWLRNRTTLKLAFGQTYQQKKENDKITWEDPSKSTDKIDLESLFQFTLQSWVDPFIGLRAESQFLDQSDAALTRYVNPILFTETAGVMRTWMKTSSDELSTRLGAAFREKLDRDVLVDAINDKREMQTTVDGGLEFVSEYKHLFHMMDANFKSKLWAYKALFNSKSDELPNDDWKEVDWIWENVLTAKIWKMINANLTVELRYDKEQHKNVQWKQILGLGVSYNLF